MPEKLSLGQLYSMIREKARSIKSVTRSQEAAALFARYRNRRQEYFLLASLGADCGLIRTHEITKGLVNESLVHPRETFRPAILDSAHSIILCHNHPSGSLNPSQGDIAVTRKLRESGEILGIPVTDHIIISRAGYYSFKDFGLL